MSELPTELTNQVDDGYPDMALADELSVEAHVPAGVSGWDIGEVVLSAAEHADEAFGRLEENDLPEVRAMDYGASDSSDDLPPPGGPGNFDSADTPPGSWSNGRPPNKPPDHGDDMDDEIPDPEGDRERRAAMAEAGALIGNIGRFTHGPQSEELRLGEDTQVTDRLRTELSRGLVDSGLEPDSVVGRQATTHRPFDDLGIHTLVKAHTIKEELIPLVKELDANSEGRFIPIARLFVYLEPEPDQSTVQGSDVDTFSNPSADVSVWVHSDLKVGAYMMADPFDLEQAARVESFFERLGLKGIEIPVSDEDNRLGYEKFYPDLPSQAIRQINRFAREQLR